MTKTQRLKERVEKVQEKRAGELIKELLDAAERTMHSPDPEIQRNLIDQLRLGLHRLASIFPFLKYRLPEPPARANTGALIDAEGSDTIARLYLEGHIILRSELKGSEDLTGFEPFA